MRDFDLLAAHMVGDYVLQTNEEAVKKFTERITLSVMYSSIRLRLSLVSLGLALEERGRSASWLYLLCHTISRIEKGGLRVMNGHQNRS